MLPTVPRRLYRVGLRVHGRLSDPDYPVPEPRLPGPAVDRQALADDLDVPLSLLGEALARLGRERTGSDSSLFDKNRIFERCRRTIRFAAGSLAGLYGLAGLDDLAVKIRPKRRARRRSGGPDSDGPGSGDQGDGQGTEDQGTSEEAAAPNEEPPKASESGAPAPEAAKPEAVKPDAEASDSPASGPIGIVS